MGLFVPIYKCSWDDLCLGFKSPSFFLRSVLFEAGISPDGHLDPLSYYIFGVSHSMSKLRESGSDAAALKPVGDTPIPFCSSMIQTALGTCQLSMGLRVVTISKTSHQVPADDNASAKKASIAHRDKRAIDYRHGRTGSTLTIQTSILLVPRSTA